jgi:5-methylthioadenosine/S-adenosylhomocysteine deaminase
MPSSLIRGKYIICKVRGRADTEIIEGGAVFQRNGTIVEIGKYRDLAARHHADEVIGSDQHVIIPGFVNAHHHVGLTPFQLGSPDLPVELWIGSRIASRDVDPYLDTLYSAFEMIESGVTTVQHLHGWIAGPLDKVRAAIERVIKAYADIGMRVSYSYMIRDQNRLVYTGDDEFVRQLPPDLGRELADYLKARALPLADQLALFKDLHGTHAQSERTRIQLAPANLHWCSDEALEATRDCAERYGVPMHMHVLETPYQKEYARRRAGISAVQYLHKLGLMGPALTLGHAVWLTEADIDIAAETGTRICHNCSSNLRLRSGVAALNAFLERGMTVALGIDEAGINDDRDMLQELRMALLLHRVPGIDETFPTAAQILRMATEHGAQTTPFGQEIGTLEPGKAADLVVLDWHRITYPYLDPEVPVVGAVVQRGRASAIKAVLVAGEPIYWDGRFTRIDRDAVLAELAASLGVPLRPDEERRRDLARHVLPHMERFYHGYLSDEVRRPFYERSSRS